ncbi:MAG TPA: glycosyltransferase [Gemmataceae bacterium]|jgi:glycosyltransferase involved in cell wall biosynthesis|nr:glycosyltransferase [Gemmataceae bacterium]
MSRRRLLMACPNSWDSPLQVGSHHLARCFVHAGWDVAFLSDPISPWHLCRGLTDDLRRRFAVYRAGGKEDLDGHLWTYVPAALMTPHNKPILRSDFVHRHWPRWTWPDVAGRVRRRGFGRVDLLYIDSAHQSFWLDAVTYRQAVYRVADYNPHFEKYTPATRALEEEMARRVDLVVYPSRGLRGYAEALGARRSLYLPNGVAYEHFARPQPPPPEYRRLRRPIAVYLGVMPAWFNFAWIRSAARELPAMSFVLIGPDQLARRELRGAANVHLLGSRDFATVPAYLQHADVGLMPFDARRNPRGVDVLNPQKLYAYLACGLPVVSSTWEEIQNLGSPAKVCASAEEFVAALRQAVCEPGDADMRRQYAARFAWQHRVTALLAELSLNAGHTRAA